MKKNFWLRPGKQLNTGAMVGGLGFALYLLLSALGQDTASLIAAIAFGVEAGYTFFSAVDCREKDKDSVSYNLLWGTGALMILLLVPAVLTVKMQLGL